MVGLEFGWKWFYFTQGDPKSPQTKGNFFRIFFVDFRKMPFFIFVELQTNTKFGK
jgi:hypothetical protein